MFNYEDGVVADTEGTWLAGAEGPAAMIMPGDPQVGDVYRPENAPGIVFEEVTVKKIGKTVEGPRGSVDGAIVVEELHQDGKLEGKTFAPGYGEFLTGGGGDLEALALAVPTDAVSGPSPAELKTLSSPSTNVDGLRAAWKTHRNAGVPKLLAAQMTGALERLARARNSLKARQAAIDVAQAGLDLQLRYRPPAEIDRARFDLWARQLLFDAAAGRKAAVIGDVTTLEWIRDRIAHTFVGSNRNRVDAQLRYLRAAAEAEELTSVTNAATRLRETLRG